MAAVDLLAFAAPLPVPELALSDIVMAGLAVPAGPGLTATVSPALVQAAVAAGLVVVALGALLPPLGPVAAALGWIALIAAMGLVDCGAMLVSPGLLVLAGAAAMAVLVLARPPAGMVPLLLMVFPAAGLAALAASRLVTGLWDGAPGAVVLAAAAGAAVLPGLAVRAGAQLPAALALAFLGAVAVLPASLMNTVECVPAPVLWPAVALALTAGLGLGLFQRWRCGRAAP